MNFLYFDTETTGVLPKVFTTLEDTPRIVQLAAILYNLEDGEVIQFNTIIKPDNWAVPATAAAVHGISTESANKYGIPIKVALATFSNMVKAANAVIAHNIAFDRQIIDFELQRINKPNRLNDVKQVCTMQSMIHVCNIPGRFGKPKWPKLQEAYVHLFGEEFVGAHDALADVRACMRIHQHLEAQR